MHQPVLPHVFATYCVWLVVDIYTTIAEEVLLECRNPIFQLYAMISNLTPITDPPIHLFCLTAVICDLNASFLRLRARGNQRTYDTNYYHLVCTRMQPVFVDTHTTEQVVLYAPYSPIFVARLRTKRTPTYG